MATPNHWSTGIFECCQDCSICLYGWCCAPCLYGTNSAKLQGTGCVGPCLLYTFCYPFACIFAGTTRGDIRSKYNLPEDPCSDCCVHCCCSACALCQEAREMRHRAKATAGNVAYPPPPQF